MGCSGEGHIMGKIIYTSRALKLVSKVLVVSKSSNDYDDFSKGEKSSGKCRSLNQPSEKLKTWRDILQLHEHCDIACPFV